MIQFLKSCDSGELHCIKKLEPNFTIHRFESQKKFFWTLSEEEKKALKLEIQKGFNFAKKLVQNEECNILILDEVLGAIKNGMISTEQIKELIEIKPDHMEFIFTGRNVPEELAEIADLITEMKMIKHPFQKGIGSREGIEN